MGLMGLMGGRIRSFVFISVKVFKVFKVFKVIKDFKDIKVFKV